MNFREQVEQYHRKLRRFQAWEARQPPAGRDPASLIADIGTILDWIPREERLRDPDPNKLGIQRMHAALRHIRTGS